MPFNPSAMFPLAPREHAFSRFDYDTPDSLAAVQDSEYFRAAFFRLRVGDIINVVSRNGEELATCELVVIGLEHPDVLTRVLPSNADLLARIEKLEAAVAALLPAEEPEKRARKNQAAA